MPKPPWGITIQIQIQIHCRHDPYWARLIRYCQDNMACIGSGLPSNDGDGWVRLNQSGSSDSGDDEDEELDSRVRKLLEKMTLDDTSGLVDGLSNLEYEGGELRRLL